MPVVVYGFLFFPLQAAFNQLNGNKEISLCLNKKILDLGNRYRRVGSLNLGDKSRLSRYRLPRILDSVNIGSLKRRYRRVGSF